MAPNKVTEIRDYRDLEVWQLAMDLAHAVYCSCAAMPATERYGLSAQMKSAAVSIPSNIAEGSERGSRADYARFVRVARGSAAELETQVLLARSLGLMDPAAADDLLETATRVRRMLWSLARSLERAGDD